MVRPTVLYTYLPVSSWGQSCVNCWRVHRYKSSPRKKTHHVNAVGVFFGLMLRNTHGLSLSGWRCEPFAAPSRILDPNSKGLRRSRENHPVWKPLLQQLWKNAQEESQWLRLGCLNCCPLFSSWSMRAGVAWQGARHGNIVGLNLQQRGERGGFGQAAVHGRGALHFSLLNGVTCLEHCAMWIICFDASTFCQRRALRLGRPQGCHAQRWFEREIW